MSELEGCEVEKVLLDNRRLFLMTEITESVVQKLVQEIMVLDGLSHEPIDLFISSCGGSVDAGLALYDVMRTSTSPIRTIGMGQVASMASIILTAGDQRFAFPHSSIMIHQPSGGVIGKSDDIAIYNNELLKVQDILAAILALHTNNTVSKVKKDITRDKYMTAEEAKKYGIIDKVVKHNKVKKPVHKRQKTGTKSTNQR